MERSSGKKKNGGHVLLAGSCFCIALLAHPASVRADAASSGDLKKLSLEELLDIEVSSVSRRPELLANAASAIQVITREDIRRSGALNLADALRLAANLQVLRANASQWSISARGFNNVIANKLLVMIDGRTVYTPLYAGVFWDVQGTLLEDIEQIEVISGPGGTLWGANAVNGVINIKTKSARDTQGVYLAAAAGNEVKGHGEFRYGGQAGDVSYRVYVRGIDHDDTTLFSGADARDAWRSRQGGFRFDWGDASDSLTLQSDYYDAVPNPDGAIATDSTGGNVLARWRRVTGERSGMQLQFYADRTKRDFGNGFAERLQTYDLDWQNRFPIGQRHEFIWGAGLRFMDHSVDNLALFAFLPGDKTLNLYSAFIQDEMTFFDERVRFTLGSKFEHNEYTGLEIQPNVRLAWTPAESQTIWASVSRAVRTPARIDRDFYLSATPTLRVIAGNGFESEELIAYEAGWRTRVFETASISLATFFNDYDELRSAVPGPPPFNLPITFQNGVQGESYGVEWSGTYSVSDNWRLRAGYTFFKKHLKVQTGAVDLNGASAESNDAEQQAVAQSLLTLPYGVQFDLVARYVDTLPRPHVDSRFDLDARLAWWPTERLEIAIAGQGLLDKSQREFIPTSPSPREIERSYYGFISWRH
jgi:iron complex outermembrane recepter protein